MDVSRDIQEAHYNHHDRCYEKQQESKQTDHRRALSSVARKQYQDKYAPENMMLYRTSLALYRNMADSGTITEGTYRKIRTILTKKYGLTSDSIFAESA